MPLLDLQGFVASIPDVLLNAVETNPLLGYGVIALVMLLENVVPPIPSEVVMPLAGFLVQQGKLGLVPVMLAGLLGSVMGAWFWYGVGRLINEEHLEHWVARRGRWLGIHPEALATSRRWFNRHGVAVVFWGRVVPGVRTLVSVPAGIELMPQRTFLLWTTAGSFLWLLFLLLAGWSAGGGLQADCGLDRAHREGDDLVDRVGNWCSPVLGPDQGYSASAAGLTPGETGP